MNRDDFSDDLQTAKNGRSWIPHDCAKLCHIVFPPSKQSASLQQQQQKNQPKISIYMVDGITTQSIGCPEL